MPFLLAAALALQVQIQVGPPADRKRPTVVRDSTPGSVELAGRRGRRRAAVRLPVTAQVLATAFRDPTARTLLMRARAERMSQDSSLEAYDATAYQRISAGMGFAKIGRDRLIFRTENVSRVRWQRGIGAYVDVKGARTVIPVAPAEGQKEAQEELIDELDDMTPIPYYPGHEALWIGSGVAKGQVDERELVHPLAEGAEAYYQYESGDSVSFRLPNGNTVRLRELRVRPREPKWNVAVGSLWFDTKSGQLVRAAYRLSAPLDIWSIAKEEDPKAQDDVPKWVLPLISPMSAQISAIAVEYGLYEGRFWLPRMQTAEGSARVSFMRVPFKMEQSFKYASVNARDTTLQPIAINEGLRLDTLSDSVREHVRDSLRTARRARRDSIREGTLKPPPRIAQCDTSEYRRSTDRRYDEAQISVSYRVPCDLKKLANAPELPASIYDPGEEIFGSKERDALIAEALSLTAQPPFLLGSGRLPPPTLKWGSEFMRYNRVEGFSAGAELEQPLGSGYTARALGRLGVADFEPNVELTLERSNLAKSVRVTGYNRLVAANDWGNPLSFGSSLSALLFGRDEGFYYRASGVELAGAHDPRSQGAHFSWRLFAEQERTAKQKTDFSLGATFVPNIVSDAASYAGAGWRVNHSAGLDPRGFRLLTDIRLEAASALTKRDSIWNRYARGAADFTFSHGLPEKLVGAVTLSGGMTAGELPAQRRWYLGGAQTVRGQTPDTAQSGNAFWMTRTELGRDFGGWRPSVFSDFGWVGERTDLFKNRVGRPMSGVGAGSSVMDGLIRLDVARGLYPRKQWRVDMYVEARF
jgi:hypothetical protein